MIRNIGINIWEVDIGLFMGSICRQGNVLVFSCKRRILQVAISQSNHIERNGMIYVEIKYDRCMFLQPLCYILCAICHNTFALSLHAIIGMCLCMCCGIMFGLAHSMYLCSLLVTNLYDKTYMTCGAENFMEIDMDLFKLYQERYPIIMCVIYESILCLGVIVNSI